MLLNTVEEIKKFKPIMSSFSYGDLKPTLKQVEVNMIMKLVGQDQYNDIDVAWQTPNSATPEQKNLRELMCEAIVPLSFLRWIPWGNVKISSAGIQIATTETMKAAFQWQVDEIRTACLHEGLSALNNMLDFLEKNIADYPLYSASPERTSNLKKTIANGNQLEKYVKVAYPHYVYSMITHLIERVERTFLLAILGAPQWEQIQNELASGVINSEVNNLLVMIRPAVANMAMSMAANELSFFINQDGVVSISGENTQTTKATRPAEDNRISSYILQCRSHANADFAELKKYLHQNISLYPLYANSPSYVANFNTSLNSPNSGFYAALT
jgi:hypothetical protein